MTARGLITTLTVTALGLSSSLGAATVRGHRVSGRHPHARFAGHSHGAHHGSFRRHAGYHGGYHHGFSHYG
ncbi:MAG: nickel transporter, partial [Acidobacteriota bacterium]